MNFIAPRAEPRIREIPLSLLSLAPENVRKTPPDACADVTAQGVDRRHRPAGEPGRPDRRAR